ncbi:MAG: DUF2807 domain-containing protein [Bacteroidota bacterium]
MRYIIFSLLFTLSASSIFAQIKGNGKMETRTFDFKNIEHVDISFYANITIDYNAPEGMTLTTDANLFQHIQKEMKGNTLVLGQLKWVQTSKHAVIKIGAPNLKKLTSGTHDITKVMNIDNQELRIEAEVGDVRLFGQTELLKLNIKNADVDASNLVAQNAKVKITSWGSAKVNVVNELDANVTDDGDLKVLKNPKSLKGNSTEAIANAKRKVDPSVRWIDLKIKNNSGNRQSLLVIGPKPDGKKFSYGFPLMPNQGRKEHWTVGTKVYKVNDFGIRKLLVTIGDNDENRTVELF